MGLLFGESMSVFRKHSVCVCEHGGSSQGPAVGFGYVGFTLANLLVADVRCLLQIVIPTDYQTILLGKDSARLDGAPEFCTK